MADYFKKLPGFVKSPTGIEWVLFKRLPWIFLIGTTLPAIYGYYQYRNATMPEHELQKLFYLCISLIGLHWTFVVLIAIGCIVVMIMKGPAYVADAYELPKEDRHLEPNNHRQS